MAKISSNMLPLNSEATDFSLIDVVSGKLFHLNTSDIYTATIIMFICNHCPFVKHVAAQITSLANDYQPKNINFIAINSNDITTYPSDSPENMIKAAEEYHFSFPYLFDETQEIAKAYQAACTPDFYIFNQENKLVYRGQLDDSRPGNAIPVTGKDIRTALDCLIYNQPIPSEQKPSLGCNIKWKQP